MESSDRSPPHYGARVTSAEFAGAEFVTEAAIVDDDDDDDGDAVVVVV